MTQVEVSIYGPNQTEGSPLVLTPTAIKHIKKILARQAGKRRFRLSVKRSGCSGFAYVVDYVDSLCPGDLQFSVDSDLIAFVDRASFPMLKGVCIDYIQNGLNGALSFINPNQTAVCGCGESFSVGEK